MFRNIVENGGEWLLKNQDKNSSVGSQFMCIFKHEDESDLPDERIIDWLQNGSTVNPVEC